VEVAEALADALSVTPSVVLLAEAEALALLSTISQLPKSLLAVSLLALAWLIDLRISEPCFVLRSLEAPAMAAESAGLAAASVGLIASRVLEVFDIVKISVQR
jgi:hypothetical protein